MHILSKLSLKEEIQSQLNKTRLKVFVIIVITETVHHTITPPPHKHTHALCLIFSPWITPSGPRWRMGISVGDNVWKTAASTTRLTQPWRLIPAGARQARWSERRVGLGRVFQLLIVWTEQLISSFKWRPGSSLRQVFETWVLCGSHTRLAALTSRRPSLPKTNPVLTKTEAKLLWARLTSGPTKARSRAGSWRWRTRAGFQGIFN